jgi:hypothetical protein
LQAALRRPGFPDCESPGILVTVNNVILPVELVAQREKEKDGSPNERGQQRGAA